MKRLIIPIVALCLILCGCTSDESVPPVSKPPDFFEQVDQKAEQIQDQWAQAGADSVIRAELEEAVSHESYFEHLGEDKLYNFSLYRDIRTDIMYCVRSSTVYRGRGEAITVMYGPDGLPLTYTAWKQMEVPNG